ncbi:hypothetical protein D3C80_1706450 [compost metagenome]
MALPALTSEPSPLTIISGAWISSLASRPWTESINWLTWAIMRAFSAAVSARRGAPSDDASSWPQLTGLPARLLTSSCTRSSWQGLRTLKLAEMAKAETRSR